MRTEPDPLPGINASAKDANQVPEVEKDVAIVMVAIERPNEGSEGTGMRPSA